MTPTPEAIAQRWLDARGIKISTLNHDEHLFLLAEYAGHAVAAERRRCLSLVTDEIDGDGAHDAVLSTIARRIDVDSEDGRWQAKLDGMRKGK